MNISDQYNKRCLAGLWYDKGRENIKKIVVGKLSLEGGGQTPEGVCVKAEKKNGKIV